VLAARLPPFNPLPRRRLGPVRIARRLVVACTAAAACWALGASGSLASAATLNRGFADDVWFDAPAYGISQHTWVLRTLATGARFAQIEVDWTGLEPSAPTSRENPTSPAGAQFNFGSLDPEVEELTKAGIHPVFLVTDAPTWAEGQGGTAADYASGGYEPNATAFGDLGEAIAKRYSGSFRFRHRRLPRVRYFQAWAEANMSNHLSPQWSRINGRAVNTGPIIYRAMLNAFYAGVHAGDASDIVMTAGFESYGDIPFHAPYRTHPVTFLENLLCLSARLRSSGCPEPAHFDVLASDPYDINAPTAPAVSPLDASAPDLPRLMRVVRAGLAAHTLFPSRPKQLWVTEFGYDSDPPNPTPGTISTATQARWLEESFYVFWHEHVSTVLWYLVRDQVPPYTANYFSGVFFRDGQPKPSYTAYRFPFVVMHNGGHAQVWGISPASGTVQVEIRDASGWRTVMSLPDKAGAVYTRTLALSHGTYRATVQGQNSLPWSYTASKPTSGSQNPVISL
jgi:hypothetical protein